MAGKKGGLEVEGVGSVELLGVGEAERSARGHDGEFATAAGGPAALAAGGIIDAIGDGGCSFHFFLHGEVGIPHPRVFFVRVANKGVRFDAASRASRTERRFKVDPSAPLRAGSLKLKWEGASC